MRRALRDPLLWALLLLLAAMLFWHVAAAEACGTATVVSIEAVIDGDTFRAELQIWPKVIITETVRVLHVDTPERRDLEKWRAAREFTAAWLRADGLTVTVCKYDSFGRALATVTSATRGDLGAALLLSGHAVPYARP